MSSVLEHLPFASPIANTTLLVGIVLGLTPLVPFSLFNAADDLPRPTVLRSRGNEDTGAEERVLILGASSGCGEELAYRYAKRGTRICLVARREDALDKVATKCRQLRAAARGSSSSDSSSKDVLSYVGDVSSPADMVKVREGIIAAWAGLDTVHIISGVTSTEPLLQGAGVKQVKASSSSASSSNTSVGSTRNAIFVSANSAQTFTNGDQSDSRESALPTEEGLKSVLEDARKCAEVNIYGMANATACFLPLLASTSSSPLIHHLSSVAALIPAPTRSLYAATKAGGLALFRSVAAEVGGENGVGVRFLAICPGTIDTDFRRNSLSSKRGVVSAEGFDKKLLTVDQTIDSILHHCDRPPRAAPIGVSLPILGLRLQIPFLRVAPSDVVFLPEMPYRIGYWLLNTPLRSMIAKQGRRKYHLT